MRPTLSARAASRPTAPGRPAQGQERFPKIDRTARVRQMRSTGARGERPWTFRCMRRHAPHQKQGRAPDKCSGGDKKYEAEHRATSNSISRRRVIYGGCVVNKLHQARPSFAQQGRGGWSGRTGAHARLRACETISALMLRSASRNIAPKRGLRARLEGWRHGRDSRPSFETRARKSALLRTRSEIVSHAPSRAMPGQDAVAVLRHRNMR